MAESYRAMEQRHEAADWEMERQEWYGRWAGDGPDHEVAEEEPAIVRDCTNCHNGDGSTPPNCRVADKRLVFGDGEIVCYAGAWDPVDEVAA